MTAAMQDFSPIAQQVIQTLEDTARFHAMSKGTGWAIVTEEQLKGIDGIGLGDNPPTDAEKLAEWEPSPVRAAIEEIRNAGVAISMSRGQSQRIVQLDGVRLTKDQVSGGR